MKESCQECPFFRKPNAKVTVAPIAGSGTQQSMTEYTFATCALGTSLGVTITTLSKDTKSLKTIASGCEVNKSGSNEPSEAASRAASIQPRILTGRAMIGEASGTPSYVNPNAPGSPLDLLGDNDESMAVNVGSLTNCRQCTFFISGSELFDRGIAAVGACAKRGIALTQETSMQNAPVCDVARVGPGSPDFIGDFDMFSIADGLMNINVGELIEEAEAVQPPETYVSDKDVTPEDEARGVRAWRRVENPADSSLYVHMPVYREDYFEPSERALIPKTGDDEHPENYVDHHGILYRVAIAWFALNETPALWGVAGTGKSSPVDTAVLTPLGWRQIGDLEVGDEVIGRNGCATKVTGVFPQGVIHTNRVTMTDGSSVLVGDDHLWQTWTAKQETNWRTGEKRVNPKGSVLSTAELIDRGLTTSSGFKFRIPMVEPVEFAREDLAIHPYVLGAMLANGSFGAGEAMLTTNDTFIVDACRIFGGHEIDERTPTPTRRWKIQAPLTLEGRRSKKAGLWFEIKRAGLAGLKSAAKFIPIEYTRGASADRTLLLAGLMDGDGSVSADGRRTTYHTMSDQLAKSVVELVQSLGGNASQTTSPRDGANVVSIHLPFNPFMTPVKRAKWELAEHREPSRHIRSIEDAGMTEQVCIMVEAEDHLYVTEDYIVTHNTEFYRYAAWLMGLPFHRVSITASTEIDDLAGKMHYSPEKGTYFQYGRVPSAWQKPGVICIDEPNVGSPEVWQFIRPLTDNSKQLVLDMNNGERVSRHENAFLGMAMNPAWDSRNSGTLSLADADGSRLAHVSVGLPEKEVEEGIIRKACLQDGFTISKDQLKMVMAVAKDLRSASDADTLSITWGLRPQIKVARALRWLTPVQAYAFAATDYLDPEEGATVRAIVSSHTGAPEPVLRARNPRMNARR